MKSTLPSLLLLLVSTKVSPAWMMKLIPPNGCIPRVATVKNCAPLITSKAMEDIPPHLHEDLRLIQQDLCENEQRFNQYSTEIDGLIAQVFSFRAKVKNPLTLNLNEENALIRKIVDRAHQYLAQSRPEVIPKDQTSFKIPLITSRKYKIINGYNTCVRNYFGPKHVDQLKNDILQSISSNAVKTEEIRARILSAAQADIASVHAHRVKCFAALEERIKTAELPEDNSESINRLAKKEELDKGFKLMDRNLKEAEKDLADWRTRQEEIVLNLFNDLLSQKSQMEVLQSQEDRLNALGTLPKMDKTNKKADELFPINTNTKSSQRSQKMMGEYLRCCVHPKLIQWTSELRRELSQESASLTRRLDNRQLADRRAKFVYYWGRHLIRIHLDFANAMADSLHCFVETQRLLFYEDARVK